MKWTEQGRAGEKEQTADRDGQTADRVGQTAGGKGKWNDKDQRENPAGVR